MTITYSGEVQRASILAFVKLLFRWRGSIYKLMYREMVVFIVAYYVVALLYRHALSTHAQRSFEHWSTYCRVFLDRIPMTFVLGFYVSVVAGRWWDQFKAIPFPDRFNIKVTSYICGTDKTSRLIRRGLVRYINLMTTLLLRVRSGGRIHQKSISTKIYRRFPTIESLKLAGLITDAEIAIYNKLPATTPNPLWMVPAVWAANLVVFARRRGLISEQAAVSLTEEICFYRGKGGDLMDLDWICLPLVYTQVVTQAVYAYAIGCVFGRQYLIETDDAVVRVTNVIDKYVPWATMLEIMFFIGLLKVAEVMLAPMGDDDDDFDLDWITDRNIEFSYLMSDTWCGVVPDLAQDAFFDSEVALVPPAVDKHGILHRAQAFPGTAMYLMRSRGRSFSGIANVADRLSQSISRSRTRSSVPLHTARSSLTPRPPPRPAVSPVLKDRRRASRASLITHSDDWHTAMRGSARHEPFSPLSSFARLTDRNRTPSRIRLPTRNGDTVSPRPHPHLQIPELLITQPECDRPRPLCVRPGTPPAREITLQEKADAAQYVHERV